MELTGLGPNRKLGDEVELAKEFAYLLAGIITLAELFKLREDAVKCLLGLANGDVRVVLALPFETRMVLEKFLAVERRKALAGRSPQRPSWT